MKTNLLQRIGTGMVLIFSLISMCSCGSQKKSDSSDVADSIELALWRGKIPMEVTIIDTTAEGFSLDTAALATQFPNAQFKVQRMTAEEYTASREIDLSFDGWVEEEK